jgi:site-specific DNA-methyltransferase (adenine-specific)
VGTVAANVLTHGTGALNIGGCRVGDSGGGTSCSNRDASGKCLGHNNAGRSTSGETRHGPEGSAGRWPANVVLDESQAAALDEQSGESVSKAGGSSGTHFSAGDPGVPTPDRPRGGHTDTGGASRFFYVAKADASERPRLPKRSLRLRDDLTPEQVDHVRARLVEAGVQVD